MLCSETMCDFDVEQSRGQGQQDVNLTRNEVKRCEVEEKGKMCCLLL